MERKICTLFIILFVLITDTYAQGSSYSGPYTPSEPVVLSGRKNLTISGLNIQNRSGNCITLSNCSNITIENCNLGPASGEGVSIRNCSDIVVKNCNIESVRTGVYALLSSGIKVIYNDVKNIKGPMPRGQMVQFDKVTGPRNRICYNVAENIAGESAPEDVISLYMSEGMPTNMLYVSGNWIRGGGPSVSGGGIMAGDRGGSYIIVEDNILVNPGQYGISVASGHHITVRNNKIYAERKPYNNVGLVAWKQYKDIETYDITIMNNEINYTNNKGTLNNMWNAKNMGNVNGWETNVYNPGLQSDILPQTIIGIGKSRVREKAHTSPAKTKKAKQYYHTSKKKKG